MIDLKGRQPWLLAQLTQAEFFAAHRTLTDRVQALADETLALDPRQPVVNDVLGIEAFDHARYVRRSDSGARRSPATTIPRQYRRYSESWASLSSVLRTMAGRWQGDLRVELTLDTRLANRLPDDASVFLVARDRHGGGPPLAVTRTTLGALPQALTLSDANAMTDTARLSQVERVDLIVRVSASGQAKPEPGDLYGVLADVAVDTLETQALTVDRVVSAQ